MPTYVSCLAVFWDWTPAPGGKKSLLEGGRRFGLFVGGRRGEDVLNLPGIGRSDVIQYIHNIPTLRFNYHVCNSLSLYGRGFFTLPFIPTR